MKNNNVTIDLSKKSHSMTAVINDNNDAIMSVQTVPGMVLMLTKLFTEHGINTKASNRLIDNVSKSYNIEDAMATVYNSFLAGTGNSVLR